MDVAIVKANGLVDFSTGLTRSKFSKTRKGNSAPGRGPGTKGMHTSSIYSSHSLSTEG